MKICLLTHTLNPKTGIGIFTTGIVDGVGRLKPDVEFLLLTSEDYLESSLSRLAKNWAYIRRQIWNADLVHAIDAYPYGVIASLANVLISKPIVLTAVGSGSVRILGGLGLKSFLLRWAYRRATTVTAISHYIANEVNKVLPGLSIEVINPCVDNDFYSQEDGGSYPNVPEGAYVITQGEFKERKGYEEILPTMRIVMDARPDVRYVIVGNAQLNKDYQKKLYSIMDRLGIRNKILVLSDLSREELRAVYRNAVLYLTLPKNFKGDVEGFGMAIMEAAATGTPAVVGRGSGADDTVSDGRSGFLVNGSDREEVVRRIMQIIDDKELRDKLSNGAKSWAKENAWDRKVVKYLELYEEV